ncbi:MAG: nucleotidyltransferase family protein [Pseudomonadota bacterium]
MIFAAGRGTRMGALTADRPKPLVPVAGRPLIDHALALATGAGITAITANTHYRAAQMEAHLRPHGIAISREAELLETGGGLKAALPLIEGDPILTLNADAVWAGGCNPLTSLTNAWHSACEALLLLVPREAATAHAGQGDFHLDAAGRCHRRAPGETAPFVYTGTQLIRRAPVAALEDRAFSLNRVWDGMIARGTLFGLVHDGHWADVGRPEGIAAAEAMLAAVPR